MLRGFISGSAVLAERNQQAAFQNCLLLFLGQEAKLLLSVHPGQLITAAGPSVASFQSLVALLEPILCFPLLDAESLGFICPCDLLTGGSGSVEAVAFLVIFLSNLLLDWLLFVDFLTRSALSFSLYIFISTHTQIYIHKQGSCCRKQIAVERGQNDTVLAAAPER